MLELVPPASSKLHGRLLKQAYILAFALKHGPQVDSNASLAGACEEHRLSLGE